MSEATELRSGSAEGSQEEQAQPVRYRPRRLGHLNFFVADFEREMTFLTAICGFEETAHQGRSGFVSNGNTHHDIGFVDLVGWQQHATSRVPEGPPDRGTVPGLNHFGFEMYNEVDLVDAYRRAIGNGMKPRITHNGTSKSNYIFDPWGTQYQLYADEVADWRTVYLGGESDLHANPPWNPLEGEADPRTYWVAEPEIRRVEEAALHPMRVTHAVLTVDNLDERREFLVQILGLDEVHRGEGVSYLAGSNGVPAIVLVQSDGEQGFHHGSFEVWPGDDLDRAQVDLEQLGAPIEYWIDAPHKKSVFIREPSGLLLEFYIRRDGDRPASRDGVPADIAYYA